MNKVTYKNIVKDLADKSGHSVQKSDDFVKGLITLIKKDLQDSGRAAITNFGSFSVKEVAQRAGKNPQTGERMIIPAHKKVSFSPYKALKETVNAPFEHLELKPVEQPDNAPAEKATNQAVETEATRPDRDSHADVPFNFKPPTLRPGQNDVSKISPEDEVDEDPFRFRGTDSPANASTKKAFRFQYDEQADEKGTDDFSRPQREEEARAPKPRNPFNFDAPSSNPFENLEEEAGEEQLPDITPKKEKAYSSRPPTFHQKQRKRSNAGVKILSVLLIAVASASAGWYYLSGTGQPPSSNNVEESRSALPAAVPNAIAEEDGNEETVVNSEDATNSASTEPAGSPESLRYAVQKDEWYWVIAEKKYGRSEWWPLIFEANQTAHDDPDNLEHAEFLIIPGSEGMALNPTKENYQQLAAATRLVSEAYTNAGKAGKATEYARYAERYERLGSN